VGGGAVAPKEEEVYLKHNGDAVSKNLEGGGGLYRSLWWVDLRMFMD